MPIDFHADHARHDLSLIAGHAAGDLSASQRLEADSILASCSECTEVRHDLLAIAAATRVLPVLATAPRDFRLTAEQAARLRRGSWLRTLLRPFGATRSAVRPLAAAFTTLGIAGLFVATAMPAVMGPAAAGTSGQERDSQTIAAPGAGGGYVPQAAATDAAYAAQGSPDAQPLATRLSQEDGKNGGATEPPYVAIAGSGQSPTTDLGSGQSTTTRLSLGTTALAAGSLALLGIGLLLFGLRIAGRRVR